MSDAQKKAYAGQSGRINTDRRPWDWDSLFPNAVHRIVEIGSGMGEATAQTAREHPQWAMVAVEVHRPGIGKLLWRIREENLENLKVLEADAVDVFTDMIVPGSIDGVHIWFPDPWPKKRHHKRRLIQNRIAALLAGALKTGGYVHAATDWEPYADQILDVFTQTAGLRNRYTKWAPKPEYRPDTKFEKRGVTAGRQIRDVIFTKESI